MGLISRTYDFVAGTLAKADEVDTELNTLYNWANGNVDDANIKAGAAIAGSKLADAAVTAAKIGTLPGCRVRHSVNQVIPNNTYTPLAFNTELFDTDSMHDAVTNNSRITINTAGVYLLTAHATWQGIDNVSSRALLIRLNGIAGNDIARAQEKVSNLDQCEQIVTGIWKANVGNYFEVVAWQDSGSSLNIYVDNFSLPGFSAQWLGP